MLKAFLMMSDNGEASAAKTSSLPGQAQPAKVYKNFTLSTPEGSAKPAVSANLPKTEDPAPANLDQEQLALSEDNRP
ncbi:MAG: hypothetical protein ACT4O1_04595 [Gemmatimonadota bacterium]